jgi:hypothetical protein
VHIRKVQETVAIQRDIILFLSFWEGSCSNGLWTVGFIYCVSEISVDDMSLTWYVFSLLDPRFRSTGNFRELYLA